MVTASHEFIRTTIHSLCSESGTTLVFPTETVARYWAADYAFKSPNGAIFLDKVLSWDNFRSLFLPVKTQKPVNAIVRNMFARTFVDSPDGNRLSWFAKPVEGESNSTFAPSIATLLGRLEALARIRISNPRQYQRLPKALRCDIELVSTAYTQFLQRNNLFEPLYEHPQIAHYRAPTDVKRYVVCFPQIIAGYHQFIHDVGNPDWIETACDNLTCEDVTLEEFPNELVELRTQLRRIDQLLATGTPADEIAITVADLDHWLPYLTHECAHMGLEIAIIGGQGASSFSSGKFLVKLQAVVRHSFSLESMKALLLDTGIPWKDITLNQRLIVRAIELHILKEDLWEQKLSVLESDRPLYEYYRTIKERLLALDSAKTADTLSRVLYSILNELLNPDGWNDKDTRILTFCLDKLEAVQTAMNASGLDHIDRLYSLYLSILNQTYYVAQQTSSAIGIYPYAVSAGIGVAHHFILGASHEATSVRYDLFSTLVETVRAMGISDIEDLSAALIATYAHSGIHTYISFGRVSFSNTKVLAPSSILEQGSKVRYDGKDNYCNRLQIEFDMWKTGVKPDCIPTEKQVKWFEYALHTEFGTDRHDFAVQKAPAYVIGKIVDEHGSFTHSATSIDQYRTCPMKWASMYLFGLRETNRYQVFPFDVMEIGNLIHTVYERFFSWASGEGAFIPEKRERYLEKIHAIFENQFDTFAHDVASPPLATLMWLYREYARLIPLVVDAELTLFEQSRAIGFEQSFDVYYPDAQYRLKGRIDKILALDLSQKKIAVIDYKKTFRGSLSSYRDPQSEKRSCQLPVYAKALEDANHSEVELAAYYDASSGKYRVIWDQSNLEVKQLLLDDLEQQLEKMATQLREGDCIATPSREHCSNCPYRQICRRRYAFR